MKKNMWELWENGEKVKEIQSETQPSGEGWNAKVAESRYNTNTQTYRGYDRGSGSPGWIAAANERLARLVRR